MNKTVKILSDGTIAKVNIIVVLTGYNFGNSMGTITKIVKINVYGNRFIKIKAQYPYEKCVEFGAAITNLRKVTCEERKLYYTNLWQKQ
jgi:hypothetical protein